MLGQDGAKDGADAPNLVKDTTTADFRVDVVAESSRQPVLVDFWAPWCGPCKALTPVIEKIVKAAGGKVKLVKMNIEEHPQIAGQLGVQSIPAVIAFQKGQPVDGFTGALPESQVKGFIERLVGPLADEVTEALEEAEAALVAGDGSLAAEKFAFALTQDEGNLKAIAGLAKLYVEAGELEQAAGVLTMVPKGKEADAGITAARAALDLAEQANSLGDSAGLEAAVAANPLDHQARFDLAVALNGKGKRDDAAGHLLEIIKKDRKWNDDGARKQLIQFFESWGVMDEATLAARRKLSGLLYS